MGVRYIIGVKVESIIEGAEVAAIFISSSTIKSSNVFLAAGGKRGKRI
jgi:hypothetical protein